MERLKGERGERVKELFERLESIRQNDRLVIHFRHSYESESVLCEKRDGLIESRGTWIVTIKSNGLTEVFGRDFYTWALGVCWSKELDGESVEVCDVHICESKMII